MKFNLLIRFIGAYLLIAAVGKIIEPFRVYRVLEFDGISNASLEHWVTVGLVTAEAFLGVAGLITPAKRRVLISLAAIYSLFTVQLLLLQIGNGPKLCGCMGWFAWLFPEFKHSTGLLLNGVILLICVLAISSQRSTVLGHDFMEVRDARDV